MGQISCCNKQIKTKVDVVEYSANDFVSKIKVIQKNYRDFRKNLLQKQLSSITELKEAPQIISNNKTTYLLTMFELIHQKQLTLFDMQMHKCNNNTLLSKIKESYNKIFKIKLNSQLYIYYQEAHFKVNSVQEFEDNFQVLIIKYISERFIVSNNYLDYINSIKVEFESIVNNNNFTENSININKSGKSIENISINDENSSIIYSTRRKNKKQT